MAEGKHPMTQIATRSLFENEDVRVWEMDVPPGETFGLHHHSNDYVLYITSGADLDVDDKDHGPYMFSCKERSVFYKGRRYRKLPQRQQHAVPRGADRDQTVAACRPGSRRVHDLQRRGRDDSSAGNDLDSRERPDADPRDNACSEPGMRDGEVGARRCSIRRRPRPSEGCRARRQRKPERLRGIAQGKGRLLAAGRRRARHHQPGAKHVPADKRRSEVTRTAALRCLSPGRSSAHIPESEWLGD